MTDAGTEGALVEERQVIAVLRIVPAHPVVLEINAIRKYEDSILGCAGCTLWGARMYLIAFRPATGRILDREMR